MQSPGWQGMLLMAHLAPSTNPIFAKFAVRARIHTHTYTHTCITYSKWLAPVRRRRRPAVTSKSNPYYGNRKNHLSIAIGMCNVWAPLCVPVSPVYAHSHFIITARNQPVHARMAVVDSARMHLHPIRAFFFMLVGPCAVVFIPILYLYINGWGH